MAAMSTTTISRRSFLASSLAKSLAMSVALPWALRGLVSAESLTNGSRAASAAKIPVGLELYSVREALKKDPEGTVRAVTQMGYADVEFYAPYFEWDHARAKQMRKLMDDLGIHCYSTHNSEDYLSAKNIEHARDLNLILGSKYIVQSWSDPKPSLDGWKAVADNLNAVSEKIEPDGLKTGYHNHQSEWKAVDGQRPMDVLAKQTKPTVMLQLDVGTCIEGGGDPVAWIRANPGRIRSIHCKDWSRDPAIAYKTLFGEGVADWKGIFQAAENGGGVEFYLVEQEGSRYPELETAQRCLQMFRATHG
jgi:sugar phosphate isomerase/epimerase